MISIVLLIRRGSSHKVPYLTKKLFVTENCQERKKNQFSSVGWHWVYHPCSRRGLILKNSFPIQNALHVWVWFLLLQISGFLPFGDFVCLVVGFFFLVGIKRKNMKMDCGGRWLHLRIWLEEEKNMIKIYCMKFLKIKEIFLSYLFFYSWSSLT